MLVFVLSLSGFAAEPSWGPAVDGLSLGVTVEGPSEVYLTLQNVGVTPIDVWSSVQAGGDRHLDWYALDLTGPDGTARPIRLLDERAAAIPLKAHLEPGEGARNRVDVSEWAARIVNGGLPLAPGVWSLVATYEVGVPGGWNGKLTAGPVPLPVPDADGKLPAPPAKPTEAPTDLLADDP